MRTRGRREHHNSYLPQAQGHDEVCQKDTCDVPAGEGQWGEVRERGGGERWWGELSER